MDSLIPPASNPDELAQKIVERVEKAAENTKPPKEPSEKAVQGSWLAPYRWKKGQSGNITGLPGRKKKQCTDALDWVLGLPIPTKVRNQLQEKLGVRLRRDTTFIQAIMIGRAYGAIADTATAEWIYNRIEGTLTDKLEISGRDGRPLLPVTIIRQAVRVVKAEDGIKVLEVVSEPSSNGHNTHTTPKADTGT